MRSTAVILLSYPVPGMLILKMDAAQPRQYNMFGDKKCNPYTYHRHVCVTMTIGEEYKGKRRFDRDRCKEELQQGKVVHVLCWKVVHVFAESDGRETTAVLLRY